MESKESRKEAIRKFKERKPQRGAFAVRCTVTGQTWVGTTPNLEAIRNRFWFALRMGAHPEPSLQKEWNTHGEPAFQYEILETLDADLHPLEIARLLKVKRAHWIEQCNAKPV